MGAAIPPAAVGQWPPSRPRLTGPRNGEQVWEAWGPNAKSACAPVTSSPVVAVNLSAAQFRDDSLLREIDHALRSSALDPRWLELEITESLFLERADGGTNRTLRGLAARGIRLALDDFGTGYSSLAALKELPVQKIKIDYSFVRDIDSDRHNEAVVHAIVSLGHALDKRVVAEGVERDMQLALLRRLGCDAAQGFLLARPQLAADIGPLLTGKVSCYAAANPAFRSA